MLVEMLSIASEIGLETDSIIYCEMWTTLGSFCSRLTVELLK